MICTPRQTLLARSNHEMGGACGKHGKEQKCIDSLVARPRHRWNDNFNMYIREKLCEGVEWIYRAQHRDK